MRGAESVFVGGKPAARQEDLTGCLGEHMGPGALDGLADPEGSSSDADAEKCAKLWKKYEDEARAIIAPAGDDHRARNHLINGAYADLYLKNPELGRAGLAAYASKQVGCAMDHSLNIMGASGNYSDVDPRAMMAEYLYEQLGTGNRNLFLDIYPLHRFYAEEGFERLKECARERRPPVSTAALDGFAALERYKNTGSPDDMKEHIRSLAVHEQIEVLQNDIYNDRATRVILDLNEGNVDDASDLEWLPDVPDGVGREVGSLPADVIFSSGCDARGHVVIPFKDKRRDGNLYDVPQRMEWILVDITDHYMRNIGSKAHKDDLETLRTIAEDKGAKF